MNKTLPTPAMFLKSAFSFKEALMRDEDIIRWLKKKNEQEHVNIAKIPFDQLTEWHYDDQKGALVHRSGRFFSIEGIHVNTNWGKVSDWEQPIINQPEIGYLGFITKEFNGVLHFLMQAKIEPGNVNCVQLSPTLQATRSNYTQVHKGKKPLYLEYFKEARPDQVLLDQLQSEQGARFLKKRNRNIIIKVDKNIVVHDNFIWLTLAQIKKIMRQNSLVNMDTRTVISGISFGNFEKETMTLLDSFGYGDRHIQNGESFLRSALCAGSGLHTFEEIITFLTHMKSHFDVNIRKIPLKEIKGWIYDRSEIRHEQNKYFKVIAVNVEIGNREVFKWNQPMVEPAQEGLCAFVCKEINGVLHFAVQAKMECGNLDIIEFAPTVQCLTGNYRKTKKGALPFLDYVLKSPRNKIIFDTLQSEEGGRFYKEQNRNMIVLAGDELSSKLPEHYIWMTLNQLYEFLRFNNYLNVQARSLIAAIPFIDL